MASSDVIVNILAYDMTRGAFSQFGYAVSKMAADMERLAVTGNKTFNANFVPPEMLAAIAATEANIEGLSQKLQAIPGSIAEATALLEEQQVVSEASMANYANQLIGQSELQAQLIEEQSTLDAINSERKIAIADLKAESVEWAAIGATEAESQLATSEKSALVEKLNADYLTQSSIVNTISAELDAQNVKTAEATADIVAQRDAEAVLEAEVAGLKVSQGEITAEIQAQNVLLGKQTDLAAEAAAAKSGKLATVGGVGVGLAIGGGVELAGAVGAASGLQQATTDMQVGGGLTDAQTQQAVDNLTKLAESSRFTSAQVAQAYTTMLEKGYSLTDVMNTLGPAGVNAAEAMNTDLAPAVELVSSQYQLFKDKGMSVTDIVNQITGATHNGAGSMDDVAGALKNAGGTALETGTSFNDLATMITLLGKDGLKGTEAGTALRYAMTALTAPTATQADAQGRLGIVTVNTTSAVGNLIYGLSHATGVSKGAADAAAKLSTQYDGSVSSLQKMFAEGQKVGAIPLGDTFNQWAYSTGTLSSKLFDSQGNFLGMKNAIDVMNASFDKMHLPPEDRIKAMKDLFNVRSGQGMNLLANTPEFDKTYDTTSSKLKGTNAASSAQTEMGTYDNTMRKLGTTINDFQTKVGNTLLPILTAIGNGLNAAFGWLEAHQDVADIIRNVALAMTFAGAAMAVISVVGWIAAAAEWAAIAPWALLVIAIIAFIAIATLIFDHWGAISKFLGKLFSEIGTWAHNSFEAIKKDVGNFFSNVGKKFHDGGEAIKKHVGDAFNAVGTKIHDAFETVKKDVGGFFNGLGTKVHDGVTTIVTTIGGFFNGLGTKIHDGIAAIEKPFIDFAAYIKKHLDFYHSPAFKALLAMWTVIKNAWDTVTKAITSAVGSFFSGLGGVLHYFADQFMRVWDGLTTIIGAFFSNTGTVVHNGLTAIEKFFTDTWNWVTKTVGDFFSGLGTKVSDGLAAIGKFFTDSFNWLKKTYGDFFSGLGTDAKNAWDTIVKDVGGFFSGLGTKVNDGVTDIKKKFSDAWNDVVTGVGGFFSTLGTTIQTKFGTIITDVGTYGHNLVQGFIDAITGDIHKIEDTFTNVAKSIENFIGWHSPTAMGPGSDSDTWGPNLVSMFINGVTGKFGDLVSTFTTFGSKVEDNVTSTVTKAADWGKNLLTGFVSGITSHIPDVQGAVSNVMTTVKNWMGFMSPTKEGPGADLNSWGPNLIKGFSEGVLSATPIIEAAMQKLMSYLDTVLYSGMSTFNTESKAAWAEVTTVWTDSITELLALFTTLFAKIQNALDSTAVVMYSKGFSIGDQLAAGLKAALPEVEAAAAALASAAAAGQNSINSINANNATLQNMGSQGNITVNVPVDGKVISSVVVNRMSGQILQAGAGRMNR